MSCAGVGIRAFEVDVKHTKLQWGSGKKKRATEAFNVFPSDTICCCWVFDWGLGVVEKGIIF